MMKRVGAVILAVISIFSWVGASYIVEKNSMKHYYSDSYPFEYRDLVPVEEITGIYTEATLKPDCYINMGYECPTDGNGPWIRNAFIAAAVLNTETGETIPPTPSASDISRLRIIDVYGDQCTIVYFVDHDDHSNRYITYDYPLSNLEYNEAKVAWADNGRKTELYGTRFSLVLSEQKLREQKNGNGLVILAEFYFPAATALGAIILFISIKKENTRKCRARRNISRSIQ
ncbi:MAG: hypothetical protein J5685_07865 [Clostridiales bacterium]|nr:hypothetical protein [Clostridiales bacterium]